MSHQEEDYTVKGEAIGRRRFADVQRTKKTGGNSEKGPGDEGTPLERC